MDEARILDIDRQGAGPNFRVTWYASGSAGHTLELRINFMPADVAGEPVTREPEKPPGAR